MDSRVKLVFTKKATNDNATWQQKNPRDKKGQAMREHRLQPGTAARVPIKQVRDVRGHRAAAKVRTPFRQASNSYLEAKKRKTCDALRGNERTNHQPMTGANSFSIRLVMTNGTTYGADTLTKKCWRPHRRRDGWHYEPADFGLKRGRRVGGIGLADRNAP